MWERFGQFLCQWVHLVPSRPDAGAVGNLLLFGGTLSGDHNCPRVHFLHLQSLLNGLRNFRYNQESIATCMTLNQVIQVTIANYRQQSSK